MTAIGDCFEVAGEYIALFGKDGCLLCHGIVFHSLVGRHHHAWIEKKKQVIDMSNGHDWQGPAQEYYKMGNINPNEVKKYSWEEAVHFMLETEHYGPWEKIGIGDEI